MGVTAWLARLATRTAHVLVIEAPHGWSTRVALERAAAQRGWALADSPADADVLAVCGVPGPELGRVIERVWDQLPGPRARLDLADWHGPRVLDDAVAVLEDVGHQRHDASGRRMPAPDKVDHGDMDHGDMDHGDMDHGDMDHGDMDHGDMDHGDMEMAPHGIPLAEGGDDRDGLEMDVLHVTLGPVLPHWPAGLVLRCALQGDVVTEAEAQWVDADSEGMRDRQGHDDWVTRTSAHRAARWCDGAAQLLALAGWSRAAAQARSARDVLMADREDSAAVPQLDALQRRVASSRLLRWSLRGIGVVEPDASRAQAGAAADAVGDVHARLLLMLRNAQAAAGRSTATTSGDHGQQVGGMPLDALSSLVTGLDLAAARLVVASVAPLLDRPGVPTHA